MEGAESTVYEQNTNFYEGYSSVAAPGLSAKSISVATLQVGRAGKKQAPAQILLDNPLL